MTTTISTRLVLRFPINLLDKPVIHTLTLKFDLIFNILKAHIIPNKEGLVVVELTGKPDRIHKALQYLEEANVTIEKLAQDIIRDEEECVHCGLCVAYCPAGALYYDESMHVKYDNEKCVACEECTRICPTHAFKVKF